jgi:hypothetical protein
MQQQGLGRYFMAGVRMPCATYFVMAFNSYFPHVLRGYGVMHLIANVIWNYELFNHLNVS